MIIIHKSRVDTRPDPTRPDRSPRRPQTASFLEADEESPRDWDNRYFSQQELAFNVIHRKQHRTSNRNMTREVMTSRSVSHCTGRMGIYTVFRHAINLSSVQQKTTRQRRGVLP